MTRAQWQRNIEQIELFATGEQKRVIGITGIRRGAGTTLVCRHLARTIAAGSLKTLLVDLSEAETAGRAGDQWRPGHNNARAWIVATDEGYDLLRVHTNVDTRAFVGNLSTLREAFSTELKDYARIIVDLPPLLDVSVTGINPNAAAKSCDQLLLLCAIGRDTQSEINEAVSLLAGAGASLSGVISNEYLHIAPREELAMLTGRLRHRLRRSLEADRGQLIQQRGG